MELKENSPASDIASPSQLSFDYKKELHTASRTMIMVHDAKTLIRMIARTLVYKVKASHAGIALQNREEKSYILNVSRGPLGLKIPAGLTRLDLNNPLIRFFREHKSRDLFKNDALSYSQGKYLAEQLKNTEMAELLNGSLYQMEIFETVLCVPSYHRDELVGVLFLGKKQDGSEYLDDEIDFFITLSHDVAMAIKNAQLFEQIEAELEEKEQLVNKNKQLFLHITFALAAAIEAKDHYTGGHTNRVTEVSELIARKIVQKNKELGDEKFLEDVKIAGQLHDIGKIGIPGAILNKQGPLTDEERTIINQHTIIGVNILQRVAELEIAMQGVKHHHERYDGRGYPDGLKGEEIPLVAAIIAVADTFDAMISDRPYRKGLSKEFAVKEIERNSGTQFNPLAVSAFLELVTDGVI